MAKVLIGWAEESLVPDKKVFLAGQFYERISEYVETPINATAMSINYGEEKAIIISCDLTAVNGALMEKVREKFASMTNEVNPMNIIIAATHTHTSVKYAVGLSRIADIINEFLPEEKKYTTKIKADNDDVLNETAAIEFLSDRIATAAKRAWENRSEAFYANAFGRAAIGFCRRVCYSDGSAQMWGDTNTADFTALEGGNDSGIELLYIYDTDKKLTGIVANIACPAQILEHRNFISADYWGEAKKILREKFGDIYFLTLCGAAGDQCPRDLVRWVEPETPINDPNISRPNVIERNADPSMFDLSGCRLAGKRVANEIISVYEEITEIKEDIPFKHKALVLDLPLRKATISDYQTAVREIEYYVAKNKDIKQFDFKDNAAMHVYAGTISRYRQQQTTEILSSEVHILRFGDVAFVSFPFEIFLDYGNYIKARSFAKQSFIMELTCGSLGYLPTEKAEKGGHYSAYISSGNVGHEGGDILVRKTVTEINRMFGSNENDK